MKTARYRMKSLSLATLAALAAFPALAPAGDSDPGRRIDNGRVDLHPIGAQAEVAPFRDFPLPSGVSRSDLAAMHSAQAALPARSPEVRATLDDEGLGALFASGRANLSEAARRRLDTMANALRGKPGLRLSIVGHTDDQRLSANARRHFRDNQGLSQARALAVAVYLRHSLALESAHIAIAGHGESQPVASNRLPEGMARNRRVEVSAWHEEAPAQVAPLTPPPCVPGVGDADLPFRVTVDGEAMNLGEAANEADRQRCTDVALAQADIQVRYDDLATRPTLNIWTLADATVRGEAAVFAAHSNYAAWIARAEVRIFRRGQKPDARPLAILPLRWDENVPWGVPATEGEDYAYLLRVYDRDERFDESSLKDLNVVARRRPATDLDRPEREALTGWGENALALRNIPVRGGTVTVHGRDLPAGHRVSALGFAVPVDSAGRFALRQILPPGPQSVELSVTDPNGVTASFRRNVNIPDDDWFYVALGDLTLGRNHVRGPAELVSGDEQHYRNETYVDGRGAFYLKGKIKGEWLLTAAADTREQPLEDLFSNFSRKDPRYLLRSIDPNAYYPVYGDDSTTLDDAPTQGKFYVRLERGDSHVMWGNFQTQWSGSELAQYSRGLYGAKLRFRSEAMTAFGERRTALDAFAADPGTLGARDEFRGTGGSLYYLRHQDITQGSERVWVEVRDKDSGLVLERRELVPSQDYEINVLQGRILLREPLSSTASGGGLVLTSALGGQPLFLVTTYEYAPGLTAPDSLATGLRASHWISDALKLGVSTFHQGEAGASQTLREADVTLRLGPGTGIKVELAHSSGPGSGASNSLDGGFGFNAQSGAGGEAMAKRIDATLDLADVVDGGRGTLSAYWQDRERGYSAPGQIALNGEATSQGGVRANLPLSAQDEINVKADVRHGESQHGGNAELAWKHRVDDVWAVSVGIRHDDRDTRIVNRSPLLSQSGTRTDAIARTDYQPLRPDGKPGEREDWSAYGFVQGTVERSGERDPNNRGGLGGSWQVHDRLRLSAEASDGNLGLGGRLGADYRISDRSNAYLNYVLETENPNYAYRGRTGTWVSGSEYRVSEGLRLFGENRISHGAGPESLTQAFGVDLAPNDRWHYGAKLEVGTLSDPLAGDLDRRAVGISVGYKEGRTKYTGSLEFRKEDSTLSGDRQTWLTRNTLGYQLDPAWRLLGKFNLSRSNNSRGAFYDGDFHEFVLGAAYRPVQNDRWNTLFKYTHLYNLPSPGQLSPAGTVADYAQKSQVFAVDTIYDLLPWLSLGFKYGLRIGELRDNRVGGNWYSSRADLVVVRADWHFVREWDAVAEMRNLRAREARDARAGALVGVYRQIGENLKLGGGYNFTHFSDDLTDLSFRSRGWFLNVVAKY